MSNSNQDHSNQSGDDKLDMQSPDLVSQNFEKLAKLFPNCVTESATGKAIDFDLLKQELNHAVVEGNKERYRLEWPGKREAIVTANLPTTKTLRPVREDSVNFDNTENIYIEGDNLEVLKLLQESYLGKIKMIYIDPPYNTGNDFVYKDNFSKDKDKELFESGQKDELNKRLVVNPEASGRYHSDWLSMLYPRLKLARNLLKDDGVIFISIDDNEIHNLKKICEEIFGDNNFLQQIVWQRHSGGGNDSRHFATDHEYILVFAKDKNSLGKLRMPLTDEDKQDFKFKDGNFEKLGPYKTKSFSRMRPDDPRPTLTYDIKTPDGTVVRDTWKWEETRFLRALEEDKVLLRKDRNGKWQVEYKMYLNALDENDGEVEEKTKVPRSLLIDVERNSEGKKQLKEVFAKENVFNNPKPTGLIKHLMSFGLGANDILLDFFSGSGSSAQSTFELNASQGTSRKFILVQLPENCDESSEAFKSGYQLISEIGKERIRRAAKKIKEETAAEIDYGFRVYRLDESNMQDVYYRPQELDQAKMDLFGDNVKQDRTEDDLLTQVMLDWGLPLSLKIEQANVAGKKVFKVAENSLFACFDKGIDEAFAKEIAKEKPLRIVFKDAGFKDDTAKTNVKQLLKQLSPETEMKVL